MTSPAHSARPARSVQPPQPLALYGPDFAADPHSHYRQLRAHGPLAPVRIAPGIDALLVTDYQAAVDLLRDTHTFTKDPRAWQATVPADSPVLPMLGYRPTALFSDGDVHARYRDTINDSLALIEPHVLRAEVARVARQLIREFAATGSGDLVAQYARRLPLHVFTTWFGVPPEDSERIVDGIGGMFNSAEDSAAAYADLVTVVTELVAERRARPRRDLTSYFLGHPAGLDNDETVRQITLVMSAGHDPTTNLIGNALLHMLTDTRYAGFAARRSDDGPRGDQRSPVAGPAAGQFRRPLPPPRHRVPRRPAARRAAAPGLLRRGQHPVPARPFGPRRALRRQRPSVLVGGAAPVPREAASTLLIAMTAIEQLTSQLCDAELAVTASELMWRPGPFHRALVHLPVRFTPLDVTGDTALSAPSEVSISR